MTRLYRNSCILIVCNALALLGWNMIECTNNFICEQIHLSYSGIETSMVVEFVTPSGRDVPVDAYVEYAPKLLSVSAPTGPSISRVQAEGHYVDQIGWVQFAEMVDLVPRQLYEYRVGFNGAAADGGVGQWTAWMQFEAGYPKRSSADAHRQGEGAGGGVAGSAQEDGVVAVLADFGLENDRSMERLSLESGALLNAYDSIALVGDLAYNLYDEQSQRGSQFMRLMSNFTRSKPLMVAPGNHEHGDNFTNYVQRFWGIQENAGHRSGSNTNFYYSYDLGLVHYVVVNTEVYHYPEATAASPFPFTPEEQLEWLEQDLIKANDNREAVPWIVMMGHKGWYMNYWGDFRVQQQITGNFTGFDELGCKYGVDLYLTGHVHIYQRFLPVRGPSQMRFMAPPADVDRDCASEDGHTYTNPRYMPSLVVASPGDEEVAPRVTCLGTALLDKLFWDDSQEYCTAAYGFGHLQAVNRTHLYWEFVETGRADNILVLLDGDDDSQSEASSNAESESDAASGLSSVGVDELLQGAFPSQDWVDAITSTREGEQALRDEVVTVAKQYTLQERREREELQTHGLLGSAAAKAGGADRIVRDYLWIMQENHGPRDYCE